MEVPAAPPVDDRPQWGMRHLAAGFGVLALVVWFPFYAFVSLLGPQWAVIPALVVWEVFFGLAVWWFRAHPWRTLATGVGAIVLWHVVGFGLDALGWNA